MCELRQSFHYECEIARESHLLINYAVDKRIASRRRNQSNQPLRYVYQQRLKRAALHAIRSAWYRFQPADNGEELN